MHDEISVEWKILAYLWERIAQVERYFRSKRITAAVGFTPKQLGSRMSNLEKGMEGLTISAWGRSRSTTWSVELG